jgi:hypothetical protein
MIEVALQVDSKFLRTISRNIKQAPARVQNAVKGRKGRLANKALRQLTKEPGKPVYPIRWASIRQRKAFFASRGFGRGIPTQRTGALLKAWEVIFSKSKDGGIIALSNDNPAMPFVQGSRAQPFHLDTGWVQVDDVVDDFMKEAGDVVVEQWFGAGDPFQ